MSDSQPIRIKPSVVKPDQPAEAAPQQPPQTDPGQQPSPQSQPEVEPEPTPAPSPVPKPAPSPAPAIAPPPPVNFTDIKARPKLPRQQSRPRPSAKFTAFATATILLTAGALAALWPVALSAARHESTNLVGEGSHTDASEAATDYLLATWLDHHNTAAYAALARTQIAAGQPDAALTSLMHAGEGSEVEQLRVRTLIELGRASAAADAATALTTPERSQADLLLAVLAYENTGRHADSLALSPRLTSPEAARSASRAQTGQLGLAAELYAAGLLRGSSAILVKTPTSYERNLLLAHIRYTQHTRPALTEATDYLTSANALNPANTEARNLLAKVYRELGNLHDAQVQTSLVAKIQSGRP